MAKCGKPATRRVIWGMHMLYQCEKHAQQIRNLGMAMGYSPVIDLYIGSELCSQEVNEKQEAGR